MKKEIWSFGLSLLMGIVLLGLTGLPVYASTLEKELQKLKEAGIPTTLKELAPPEIPDSENAALVYQKVFDLMEKNKDDMETLKSMYYSRPDEHTSRYSNIPEWSKWSDEQKKLFPSLIEKNREIFSLLKKATSMPKCRFPIEYEKGPAISVPHLSKLRNCAYLLAIKATIEAERGKTEDALNICLIGLKLAKSLFNEPSFLSQLVRIGSIEEKIILPSLEGILNKGGAGTGLYRKILREISEERKCNVTSLALKGEACGIIVLFEQFRKNPDAGVSMFFIPYEEKEKLRLDKVVRKYRPFAENDEIFCIRTISEMISLSKQPYWQIRDKLRRIQVNIEYRLPEEKNLITKLSLKSCFLFYAYEARSDALLGAAEIGIANRIYKQKYGKYVNSLNQLTPGILSSLPLDPFTGKNYIYKKKDKGFIVYSVGDNLKDDGGTEGKRLKPDIVWEDKGASPISKNIKEETKGSLLEKLKERVNELMAKRNIDSLYALFPPRKIDETRKSRKFSYTIDKINSKDHKAVVVLTLKPLCIKEIQYWEFVDGDWYLWLVEKGKQHPGSLLFQW